MKRSKILCLTLAVLLSLCAVCACGDKSGKEDEKPKFDYIDAETLGERVSPGTQALYIDSTKNALYEGTGAEIDPYFHTSNVGHKGTTADGKSWVVEESDWENYVVPRMRDMKIERTRVMLQTSWYAKTKDTYDNKSYTWDTVEMNDLYLVLDTCQSLGMYVNITLWGITDDWLGDGGSWVQKPKDGYEEIVCEVFADAVKYLIEERNYTCIQEVTLYCEPSNQMKEFYEGNRGYEVYKDQVRSLDKIFKQYGLRDKVRFNMSDDANNHSWLEKVCIDLGDVVDLVNSHQYRMTPETSNTAFRSIGADKIDNLTEITETYGIPVMMGEFGINNEIYRESNDFDHFFSNQMGLDVARAALNYLDAGLVGICYWTLFSQVYGVNDRLLPTEELAPWGLWAYKDTDYECRPVFYAYSLITRFARRGSTIYKLRESDENLVGVTMRTDDGKWNYLVVNNSDEDKRVAFCNSYESAGTMDYYVYDLKTKYENAEMISVDHKETSDGRITETVIPAGSLVVLTNIEG